MAVYQLLSEVSNHFAATCPTCPKACPKQASICAQNHRLSIEEADLLSQFVQIMEHRIIHSRRHIIHVPQFCRFPWG